MQLYGGRMTNQRMREVTSITAEAIEKLHKQIKTCPDDTYELEDPEGLKVPLMMHQRQAIAWLVWREKQQPAGGILADDMGLGKTLTMISLIMKQKQLKENGTEEDKQTWLSRDKQLEKLSKKLVKSRATLVICPASLIHQWKTEIERRVKGSRLKVMLYHGPDRESDILRLADNDVVLTTYNLVAKEVGAADINAEDPAKDEDPDEEDKKDELSAVKHKSDSKMLRIAWDRIVLDEAHNIKNHKSLTAVAVCRLRAGFRWALTGTPIQNKLLDIFSLLRLNNFKLSDFLRCSPFDEYKLWKKQVERDNSGHSRLNVLVKCLLLRRTKNQVDKAGKPLVALPTKTVKEYEIKLSDNERKVYEKIFAQSKHDKTMELKNERNGSGGRGNQEPSLTESNTCFEKDSQYKVNCYFKYYKFQVEAVMKKLREIRDSSEKSRRQKSVIVSQWTKMLDIIAVHLDRMGVKWKTGKLKEEKKKYLTEGKSESQNLRRSENIYVDRVNNICYVYDKTTPNKETTPNKRDNTKQKRQHQTKETTPNIRDNTKQKRQHQTKETTPNKRDNTQHKRQINQQKRQTKKRDNTQQKETTPNIRHNTKQNRQHTQQKRQHQTKRDNTKHIRQHQTKETTPNKRDNTKHKRQHQTKETTPNKRDNTKQKETTPNKKRQHQTKETTPNKRDNTKHKRQHPTKETTPNKRDNTQQKRQHQTKETKIQQKRQHSTKEMTPNKRDNTQQKRQHTKHKRQHPAKEQHQTKRDKTQQKRQHPTKETTLNKRDDTKTKETTPNKKRQHQTKETTPSKREKHPTKETTPNKRDNTRQKRQHQTKRDNTKHKETTPNKRDNTKQKRQHQQRAAINK
ncbi:TTF2 [Mytilus edulis]|uniref:Transcription termination factor 2 n=1 Tax=Mytilus edulis TaxID=6550 RepID=A0A8S3R9H5_MYTED|nr:TTF2 [Mytilus edulis]